MEIGVRRFLSKREGKRSRGRGDNHHLPHPLSRKAFSTVSCSPLKSQYQLEPQAWCTKPCCLNHVAYPGILFINMHSRQRTGCFIFLRIACFFPWLTSQLTRAPLQSSPELAPSPRAVDPNSPADFFGLFDAHVPPANPTEEPKASNPQGLPHFTPADLLPQVKSLRQRLLSGKGVLLRDAQILWALRSQAANGDADTAYGLLMAMSDASEGIVTPYNPYTKMLGAQNRQGVTCFLDATLFSMFSRLDSFEAMLYNTFDDVPRNKLAFLLRLWVNLLRAGKLITTDITKVVQDTLADCGWAEAGELHQQDASEAFTFITGKLELPLLTLKMDIYHTGKEDTTDDHKFINERLLEVAIPPDPTGERKEITLEECLEDYFNNRIEVRRYLERRSTLNSIRKASGIHVETVELDGDQSPITPLSPSPSYQSPLRPAMSRGRAPSIIQERYVPPRNESGYSSLAPISTNDSVARSRAGSVRKEVMMPAWQFFSLIRMFS